MWDHTIVLLERLQQPAFYFFICVLYVQYSTKIKKSKYEKAPCFHTVLLQLKIILQQVLR